MDPITPPSSSSSPSVDSLLNDILGGQQTISAAPATTPPVPDPHSIPTLSLEPDQDSLGDRIARETEKVEAGETVERMHDILQGEPESTGEVSPGMTPVVEESKLETIPSMPTMPLDVVAPPSPMPTISAVPMPMTPVAPIPSVASSVPPATPDMTPNPQPSVAQVPHTGIPKAGIAAALVVVAVMLAGVGAGVALSGQEQDNRNQAYVAPTPVVAQSPAAAVNPASMVILPSSGENPYNEMKTTYPSAREVTVNTGGISGVISQADSEIGSKVLFARLSGVPVAAAQKKIVAWVMFANGEYAQIGDVMNVTSNGELVAFISYENFSDQALTELILSEETIASTSDTSLDVIPTQKVANVAL